MPNQIIRRKPLNPFDLITATEYINRYFGDRRVSPFGYELENRLKERTPYELRRDKYGSIDSDISLDNDNRPTLGVNSFSRIMSQNPIDVADRNKQKRSIFLR